MPVYRATVEGRDLPFLIDEQIEHIAFYKTLCFDAENLGYAAQRALDMVNEELQDKAYVPENNQGATRVFLESIERIEKDEMEPETDFFWFFPEEDDFEDIELRAEGAKSIQPSNSGSSSRAN